MSTPPGPPHGRGLRRGDPELTRDLGATAVVRADADGRGKSISITLPL
ncbi:hypothetical protein ACWDZ8_24885 [Streptomyces sp. NPDC003233]